MSARTTRVTLRFTPAQLDAAKERAQSAGEPLRTWMQKQLVDALSAGEDFRTVLCEVRKVHLLTQKLWLAAAQSDTARAEIKRIVSSVEAAHS